MLVMPTKPIFFIDIRHGKLARSLGGKNYGKNKIKVETLTFYIYICGYI